MEVQDTQKPIFSKSHLFIALRILGLTLIGSLIIIPAIYAWYHVVLFGPVSGRITDTVTGEPISDIRINLELLIETQNPLPLFYPSYEILDFAESTLTDINGYYQFPLTIKFRPMFNFLPERRLFSVNSRFGEDDQNYQEQFESVDRSYRDINGWQPFSKKDIGLMTYSRGVEYCSRVSEEKYKECIMGVASYEKEPTICDSYSEKQEEIEECYHFTINRIEPNITRPRSRFESKEGSCEDRENLSVCYKNLKGIKDSRIKTLEEGGVDPTMGL